MLMFLLPFFLLLFFLSSSLFLCSVLFILCASGTSHNLSGNFLLHREDLTSKTAHWDFRSNLMMLAPGWDQRDLALALCRLQRNTRQMVLWMFQSTKCMNVSWWQSARCKNSLLLTSRKILARFQVKQHMELWSVQKRGNKGFWLF